MQLNSTNPEYWYPPSGPNPQCFERSDHDYTQGISQLEPCDGVFQYSETPQEEADLPFHPMQWPPRQAPVYQGVQNYNLYPLPGTSSVADPAMRPALTYNAPPFSEDLTGPNGLYALNSTGPSSTMEYPDEIRRAVHQVRTESLAFPAPPGWPVSHIAPLAPEVSSNNGSRVDPVSLLTDTTIFVPAYQEGLRRNSAFSSTDSRGAAYKNPMNGPAHQIYSEDVHSPTPLVQPHAVLNPYNYGESVSNENWTRPEFVQWLNSTDKNNPAKNGYSHTPEGYGEPNSLQGIEQGIQSSPEATLASLSPTPSSEASNPRRSAVRHHEVILSRSTPSRVLQTQSGFRRVEPYPATSQAKDEPQHKSSNKIITIPLLEAVALFGPEMRECWGSKGQKKHDAVLWETRSAVEGGVSIKKRSKCRICGSLCYGSAALYHARKHLNMNTHPCQYKDCPESFAQSSDRKNHMEKIHQKSSDGSSTPTASSQDHLNNLCHG